ncbi:heterogeneous nuclear ribonucleoprotein R [Burkholderia pseudomallei]|uniref:heterogeneous nuclear ribonucleoprotein R n=1 Tax=Burkholderia pseudomallei TaxID=28450 RepID=UPI003140914B
MAARPAPRDRHEGRAGLRAEPACGRGADIANANAIANVGVSLKPNTRASRSRTT